MDNEKETLTRRFPGAPLLAEERATAKSLRCKGGRVPAEQQGGRCAQGRGREGRDEVREVDQRALTARLRSLDSTSGFYAERKHNRVCLEQSSVARE